MKPLAVLSLFALALLPASPSLPASSLHGATVDRGAFNGGWSRCDDDTGVAVCELIYVEQRGTRVCGVSEESSSNYQYRDRFVATATGDRAKLEKVCGEGGSADTSKCPGDSDVSGEAIGWTKSEASLALCNGRLVSNNTGEVGCGIARERAGLNRSSDAGFIDNFSVEDKQWLASCIAGQE
ncbi:hypothetical protein [Sphingopyxis sp. JAI128]|uniref:hypothetical protein n=1 Tax=Sphingopyxis sp. JAI128 TaxID=2723066 RepID=UPI00160FD5F9|nr:hypothetical protein [Sphingopyxis sp. JAI128]MBB6427879.1 hypothetical protein [Sphingopyxis sp. JAI128]